MRPVCAVVHAGAGGTQIGLLVVPAGWCIQPVVVFSGVKKMVGVLKKLLVYSASGGHQKLVSVFSQWWSSAVLKCVSAVQCMSGRRCCVHLLLYRNLCSVESSVDSVDTLSLPLQETKRREKEREKERKQREKELAKSRAEWEKRRLEAEKQRVERFGDDDEEVWHGVCALLCKRTTTWRGMACAWMRTVGFDFYLVLVLVLGRKQCSSSSSVPDPGEEATQRAV